MAEALDIPKSTVYRYVRTLSERGFLERTRGGSYRLGLVFIELGRHALESNRDLHLAVLPSMQRIAQATGESVSVMRMFNQQAVCIESIGGTHALRVTIERGRVQPLHAGASSKVLLAYQPEETWAQAVQVPLTRYTETTITDMPTLIAHLRQVRTQGYAVSDGEIDIGARAVAVPIRSSYGDVAAALSIEAPAIRLGADEVATYTALLLEESATIQQALD